MGCLENGFLASLYLDWFKLALGLEVGFFLQRILDKRQIFLLLPSIITLNALLWLLGSKSYWVQLGLLWYTDVLYLNSVKLTRLYEMFKIHICYLFYFSILYSLFIVYCRQVMEYNCSWDYRFLFQVSESIISKS